MLSETDLKRLHEYEQRQALIADDYEALYANFTRTLVHYHPNPKDPCFFYGGPFSNFADTPITVKSLQPWWDKDEFTAIYATVEHFYQACKAQTQEDHVKIAMANSPGESKRLGNTVDLREDWEDVKFTYMLVGLRAKFSIPAYAIALLKTGNQFIAEDSPCDFIWGIRSDAGDDGLGYRGQNLLGLGLMLTRDRLMDQVRPDSIFV